MLDFNRRNFLKGVAVTAAAGVAVAGRAEKVRRQRTVDRTTSP